MLTRRDLATLAAGSLAACQSKRPVGFAGHAFVANQAGGAVAAVDLTALAVVRHILLEAGPTELVTHSLRPIVYALTPSTGRVHEILADRLGVGRQVHLGADPQGIRVAPGGGSLWAMLPKDRQMAEVQLDRLRAVRRVTLPAAPVDFAFAPMGTPAEGALAVSLGGTGQVAFIANGSVGGVIELGGHIGKLQFRRDGKLLLAADLASRQIVAYDLVRKRVAVRLPLAVRPDHWCLKSDGGQLFITGEGADAVVTVYPFSTEIGSITLAGRTPASMAASANPDYLFVANPNSSDVTIVNIQTGKVIAVSPVGRGPCFVAVTPDSEFALVLNKDSGDMAVLHIPTISARRNKSATLTTMIPVGSQPVSAVVRGV